MATETSHHAIDTMLLEERRYPPPEEFAAQANAQPEIYDRDPDEFWETEARERVTWFEPFDDGLRMGTCRTRSGSSAASSTPRTTASTATSRPATARKVAYYWEGEPVGDRRDITFADLQRETTKLANALKSLGVEKGHAGRHLHGHGPRGADRDARLRPHRRAAHRRVRRLLGRLALRPAAGHGVRGADHAGRGVAARHDRAAEEDGRRGGRRVADA